MEMLMHCLFAGKQGTMYGIHSRDTSGGLSLWWVLILYNGPRRLGSILEDVDDAVPVRTGTVQLVVSVVGHSRDTGEVLGILRGMGTTYRKSEEIELIY